MSIQVFTATGTKSTGTVTLSKLPEISKSALAQAAHVALTNEQRMRGATKTRGMVRGGGKKPWKQKGTGRARAGSSRSPIWRGGGITFGPVGAPRTMRHANRKLAQAAILHMLQARSDSDQLIIVSGKPDVAKAKAGQELLGKFGVSGAVVLVVTDAERPAIRGLQNIARVVVHTVSSLRLTDLLRSGTAVVTEAAFAELSGKAPVTTKPAASAPKPAAKSPAKPTASPAKPAVKPAAKKSAPKKPAAKKNAS